MSPDAKLAFSMSENPGVYALLLGSGISRAASIPTGWEITLDLARLAAASEGVTDRTDWRTWHLERFGVEPGYSDLLDRLTSTLGSGRRGSFARPRRSTPTTDRPVGDDSTGEKPVDTVPVTTSA